MIEPGPASLGTRASAGLIRVGGVLIILLAGAAALLPVVGPGWGTMVVGALLLLAGLIEMLAGVIRRDTRLLALLAGTATVVAGVLLMVVPVGGLFRNVTIVTGWLLVRSLILAIDSLRAHRSLRLWLGLSAGTDLILGLGLLTGLSITTLLMTLFGETPQLVASFSWVLALSFLATGTMLLEVAGCERNDS